MAKRPRKRICRVDEIDVDLLTFPLTEEQLAKAEGEKITFRKSTQHFPKYGYRQLIARAEYNGVTASGKRRAKTAASKLVGIIWDDDPEWVCETNKARSPNPVRREEARARIEEEHRKIQNRIRAFLDEEGVYEDGTVVVNRVPLEAFLPAALVSGMAKQPDAQTMAAAWNANLDDLRSLHPDLKLEEISVEAVRRICMSITPKCVRGFFETILNPPARKSRSTLRPPIVSALDVTTEGFAASHLIVEAEHRSSARTKEIIDDLSLEGATVTIDSRNTTPDIARALTEAGAFYFLPLNGNPPVYGKRIRRNPEAVKLLHATVARMAFEAGLDLPEGRKVLIFSGSYLPRKITRHWPGLDEGCLVCAPILKEGVTEDGRRILIDETRWFATSHPCPYDDREAEALAARLEECVRAYRGVERPGRFLDAVWSQDEIRGRHLTYLRTCKAMAKIGGEIAEALSRVKDELTMTELPSGSPSGSRSASRSGKGTKRKA